MLSFIIPVRHHAPVADWTGVKARLAITLRSIAAQAHPDWNAVVVANHGADLPECPNKVEILRVDFPEILRNKAGIPLSLHDSVRTDKGRRILAGLLHLRPTGHVMVVDYDDLISARLAGIAAENPGANGWFFNDGYLFSGGDELFFYTQQFFAYCGTSHIVRADLLNIPDRFEDARDGYVYRWLGCHVFIKKDLDEKGTKLDCLPFPGAIYRIGHVGSISQSWSIELYIKKFSEGIPERARELRKRLRGLTPELADEFFAGQAE